MQHLEGTFTGYNQYKLRYQSWLPEESARAVLLIAHGIAEHSGRYQELGEFMAAGGLAVYAFDDRHHGLSEGTKGRIDDFSAIRYDFEIFLNLLQNVQPDRKIFMLGHSMGASLSMDFAAANQSNLAGLILSGSPMRIQPELPAALIGLMYPLTVITPDLGLYRLDSSTLSREKAVVRGYDSDPQVYRGKLSCRLIISFLWSLHRVEASLAAIKIPVLILHGSRDNLCSPKGAGVVCDKVGSIDKKLIMYSGLYHEILNEPEKDRVRQDILDWINARI